MSRDNEGAIGALVDIDATRKGWRLFRNLVAGVWTGKVAEEYTLKGTHDRKPVHVVELINARFYTSGLFKGSSDKIGWRPVTITPDMVGQVIAQFVSIEVKTLSYPTITPEQDNWLQEVADAGGYAAVAREQKEGGCELEEYTRKVDK